MLVHLLPCILVLGYGLCETPMSLEEWERRMEMLGPLVKRGYILHNRESGHPRYTTLVRRNFLRFGKRGGSTSAGDGVPTAPVAEPDLHRTDDLVNVMDPILDSLPAQYDREELAGPGDVDDYGTATDQDYPLIEGSHMDKRTRNFIRFGKRQRQQRQRQMSANPNQPARISNFLRFGRASELARPSHSAT